MLLVSNGNPSGPEQYRFVFIGGLHRSGTSALYSLIGDDPNVSIFRRTSVIEDEGQFLQSAYPRDNVYGGPGHFGLDPRAHLTESSPLVAAGRERLFSEWSCHWDLTKQVLAEKTPANIIQSRYLQAVFPNSAFLFMMRHPVASAMATTKWTGAYMSTLIAHWVCCHELLLSDMQCLSNASILRYEEFTSAPQAFNPQLEKALGAQPAVDWGTMKRGLNAKYFRRWREADFHLKGPLWKNYLKRWRNRWEIRSLEKRYEKVLNRFGYSFGEAWEN